MTFFNSLKANWMGCWWVGPTRWDSLHKASMSARTLLAALAGGIRSSPVRGSDSSLQSGVSNPSFESHQTFKRPSLRCAGPWPNKLTAAAGLCDRLSVRNKCATLDRSLWLCLVPLKKHYAKKRFLITLNLRYIHGVLSVDEIRN
jgi:hypothetical protein